MTNNQLKLREIREKERSNQVYEAIESGKLAETIANNLRTYKINLQKNKIQALAEGRLDERERMKISETVRNNLATLLENQRAHLADEEIRRVKNAIDSLKSKYEAGPLIGALLGLMPDNDIKALYGDGAVVKGVVGIRNIFTDAITHGLNYNIQTNNSNQKVRINQNQYDSHVQEWLNQKREKKEPNEIPTDFSSSAGPSAVASKPQTVNTYNTGSANSFTLNTESRGGTYIKDSSDGTSAIYVSPGANFKSMTGPGVN